MAQNVFQFLNEPGTQELYRDKLTGLPLANGSLTFFKDNDRTNPGGLKPVYKLTGTPADPVYVALPNPLPLTGIGTTSDGFGIDTKIYYNPFDDEGNPELYYIEVKDEDDVLQFTREGWPQQIPDDPESVTSLLENIFQDGQFLHHFDLPNSGLIPSGQNQTNLAYGGWVFLLSSGFTSVNIVTFDRFSDYVISPEESPRYALNIQTTSPNAAETQKDITWVNNNVNFLAGKTLTLQFEAISNIGVAVNVEVFYEKVYGSGGSANDLQNVGTITVNPTSYQKYPLEINISDNLGKTIGPNDDDEIRFILRLPSNVALDISFTNMMLVEGSQAVLTYPPTSDYDASLKALASSIDGPAFDNSDVGKVLTLGGRTDTAIGQTGTPLAALVWANAVPVGAVMMYTTPNFFPTGWLYCDGSSYDLVGPQETQQNITSYNELYQVIGDNYGLGEDTFTAPGGVTVDQFNATCTRFGAATAPDAHASGFGLVITTPGGPAVEQVVEVTAVAGASITAGTYFELFAPSGRSSIYWFQVDGAGIDPSATFPTSLVRMVSISSADTSSQVATAVFNVLRTQLQVPDMRGMFGRGMDDGRGLDPDAAARLDPTFTFTVGDIPGSVQEFAVEQHTHTQGVAPGAVNVPADGGTYAGPNYGNTGNLVSGNTSTETRPINMYFTFIIKA
jgi:hypothetical protein